MGEMRPFVLLVALLGCQAYGIGIHIPARRATHTTHATHATHAARGTLLRMNLFGDLAKKVERQLQEVTVQHILLPTQFDAIGLFDEIMAEGEVTPERMGQLAAARSTCGSAKKKPDAMLSQLRGQPGELKFRRGTMAAEFERRAFEAPIGELQRPFQTQFGWHILLVNER